MNLSKVNLLVLDEADRMLDMGFIHDVQKIISQCPKERQTLLFSATISERIKKLMRIKFDFNPEKRIGRKKGDSDRGLRDRTGYFGNKNARKNK